MKLVFELEEKQPIKILLKKIKNAYIKYHCEKMSDIDKVKSLLKVDTTDIRHALSNYCDYSNTDLCEICKHRKIELYHHIIPLKEEGKNEITNIIGLCRTCHQNIHRKIINRMFINVT